MHYLTEVAVKKQAKKVELRGAGDSFGVRILQQEISNLYRARNPVKEWPRMLQAVGIPKKMAKWLAIGLGIRKKIGNLGVLSFSDRGSIEEPLERAEMRVGN